MKGAGAHLHVVGLQDDAAVLGPVALQRQDQILEGAFRGKFRCKRIGHGAPHCERRATLGTATCEIKDWPRRTRGTRYFGNPEKCGGASVMSNRGAFSATRYLLAV